VSEDGQRAHASSSLQQAGYKSLIKCLSAEVRVVIRGIPQVPDGRYMGVYEGRGAHRDVYKVGNYILKLERKDAEGRYASNTEEARSLQLTADLPQTVAFYHVGDVTISGAEPQPLIVNGLLQGYGGVTYDKLIHQHGKSKLSLQMASFLISAYRELALMVIDGVQLNIAYGDMHTANIATLMDPAKHRHGQAVPSIVVDAEGVRREQWSRSTFNKCADEMLVDLELQCSKALHPTWNLLGHYMNTYVNMIFRQQGQDDLASVRERVCTRFGLLWAAFEDAYLNQCSQSGRLKPPAKHYADEATAMRVTHVSLSASSYGRLEPPAKHYAHEAAAKPVTHVSLSASSYDSIATHSPTIPGVTVIEGPIRSEKYLSAPWHQTRIASVPSSSAASSCFSSAPTETAVLMSNTNVRKRKHEPGYAVASTAMDAQWPKFENPHGHYAASLQSVASNNMDLQRSSRFRGPGAFQEDRGSRMSWEDRLALDMFEKRPEMSRAQSDDVNRLCHVMYKALHNVLARCPKNKSGRLLQRVARESEFMKYGMAKRVFHYLRQFEYTEKQWFSPSATYLVVHKEFDLLMGQGDPQLKIRGFHFIDDYEKDFLAHMITVSFLACGVLHSGERA
jgi:hypothetical protein